jgi:hypothetical protein
MGHVRRNRSLIPALLLLPALAGAAETLLPPGTYRLDMRLATETHVPVLGRSESAWTSVALVRIREEAHGLHQSHRVCAVQLDPGYPLVRARLSPGVVDGMVTRTYGVQLDADGTYRADLGIEAVGFSGGGRSVPTAANDPGVTDSDGDGNPGATVHLTMPLGATGDVYVAQRGRSVLRGRATDAGYVEGTIDVLLFEHAVLDANPQFLRAGAATRPIPDRSRFVLRRVADDATCATLSPE